MARVFITGSSTGLGLMAGQLLIEQSHEVVLHGRTRDRADDARTAAPDACGAVVGDLTMLAGMRQVAEEASQLGPFDAVIHNAGIGYREPRRIATADGLPHVFAVNVLAPYVLTALIKRPKRLVYLSSGMHHGVQPALNDITWTKRPWQGAQAYAESKLYDTVLAFAVARRWPNVLSNALEPGWVPTRMGGPGAPDDMDQAHRTQAWLATSDDPAAQVTAGYFYHLRPRDPNPAARDKQVQDTLLAICERLSGISLPV
jgi:NAD(P)-dependent dehydrogenase (short-subunit alcohol dehydrogenase family)